jgi:hypothetical protein
MTNEEMAKARFRKAAQNMARAIRRIDDEPYPDEPYMSMDDAAGVHARLVATEPAADDVERVAYEQDIKDHAAFLYDYGGKICNCSAIGHLHEPFCLGLRHIEAAQALSATLAALSPAPVPDVAGLVGRIRKTVADWACVPQIPGSAADIHLKLLSEALDALTRQEDVLERCAELVEEWNGETHDGDTFHIAQAIRNLADKQP